MCVCMRACVCVCVSTTFILFIKYNKRIALKELSGRTDIIITKAEILKEKITDGMKVSNPKTPKFYIQQRIHKKDNSGRTVVS